MFVYVQVQVQYVDQKDSVALLTAKRTAGVILEMNLKNPLYAGNKAHKSRIHSGFKTQGRYHQKSKTGVSDVLQKYFLLGLRNMNLIK